MTSTIAEPLRALIVPIASLNADPANARKHGERNLEAIRASLAQFGQRVPIVVQRTGMVVRAGNGRLAAAKALGWTEIAAVIIDDDNLTATQFAIADNRTAELAEWDDEALASLLQVMAPDVHSMLGFDQPDVDALLRKIAPELVPDEVPPLPAVASTRIGDVWLCGNHRLLCGDSTSPDAVSRVLARACPFLMVTDPPYGVEYDPEWRKDAGISSGGAMGKVRNDDRVDWTEAYKLFPGDVAYVWHAGRFAGDLAANLHAAGFDIRAQIIWRKPSFAISRGHYHWQHEPCWYAVRSGKTSKWVGDRAQSTVWDISNRLQDHTEHGTQKPIDCMGRPIRNHGGATDAVYDPFLGSGTTLMAAEQLGRVCYGLELDPRYCDVIVQRWQKATGREATLEGDGRTFAQIAAERAPA